MDAFLHKKETRYCPECGSYISIKKSAPSKCKHTKEQSK